MVDPNPTVVILFWNIDVGLGIKHLTSVTDFLNTEHTRGIISLWSSVEIEVSSSTETWPFSYPATQWVSRLEIKGRDQRAVELCAEHVTVLLGNNVNMVSCNAHCP